MAERPRILLSAHVGEADMKRHACVFPIPIEENHAIGRCPLMPACKRYGLCLHHTNTNEMYFYKEILINQDILIF